MKCQNAKERMPELADGTLPAAEAGELQRHFEGCAACRAEFEQLQKTLATLDSMPEEEPSPRLRERFDAMLRSEMSASERSPSLAERLSHRLENLWGAMAPRPLLQFSYSLALVLLGLLVGSRYLAPAPAAPKADEATQKELAELRAKIDSMGQLVAYSVIRQEPDNARLRAVAAKLDNGKLERGDLTQLVNMLAFDPSTNVRLSALEALYPHADKRIVRDGVLASLSRERSPLVQLAMIDFLTSLKDGQAASAFEAITRDATTDQSVREAARLALAQL